MLCASNTIEYQNSYSMMNSQLENDHNISQRKDCLKNNLKVTCLDGKIWEAEAQNRLGWRNSVKVGCRRFETKWLVHAKFKRAVRKCVEVWFLLLWKCDFWLTHLQPQRTIAIICHICLKLCKSAAGLSSQHARKLKKQ